MPNMGLPRQYCPSHGAGTASMANRPQVSGADYDRNAIAARSRDRLATWFLETIAARQAVDRNLHFDARCFRLDYSTSAPCDGANVQDTAAERRTQRGEGKSGGCIAPEE